MVSERTSLARQPTSVKEFIIRTIKEFRKNGAAEVDVELFLDEMEDAYRQNSRIQNRLLVYTSTKEKAATWALRACLADPEGITKVVSCIATVVLGGIILTETSEEARQKTKEYIDSMSRARPRPDKEPKILYHYTNEDGMNGIVSSMEIRPSLPEELGGRKGDVRHGIGQYFTNIIPGTMTLGQLASRFYGTPWPSVQKRITHYVTINVNGLFIANPKPEIYVHISTNPLKITGRLVSFGKSDGQN